MYFVRTLYGHIIIINKQKWAMNSFYRVSINYLIEVGLLLLPWLYVAMIQIDNRLWICELGGIYFLFMYTSARKDWWYSSLSQSSYKSLSFMNPSLLGNSFSNRIVLRGILSLLLNAIAKAMVHKTNFSGFQHFHQPIDYS